MPASRTLYAVDDDQDQLDLLGLYARRLGYAFKAFESARTCLDCLAGSTQRPDGIVVDLFMPEMDGMAFTRACSQKYPDIPVLMLTVSDSADDAAHSMREGAWDFMTKPLSFERFQVTMQNMLERRDLRKEVKTLKEQMLDAVGGGEIIGQSDMMRDLMATVQRVGASELPVLLQGESGVGKELFAKAVHQASERADGPLVSVNCGAIPANLVESTLFGHEKGAFTGAHQKGAGKFRAAEGGTLFLDEIGELPLAAQVKLLRALQEREVEPVGATKPVPVNIRLIAATNRNLAAMVKEGRFREDLYYRINVYPLHIPPLRQRSEDIPQLAEYFMHRAGLHHHKEDAVITPAALDLLKQLPWPGNVRQLENAIYRAVVSADGEALKPEHFSWLMPDMALAPGAKFTGQSEPKILPLAQVEQQHIQRALAVCNGNMAEAARQLGISRATLYRRLNSSM